MAKAASDTPKLKTILIHLHHGAASGGGALNDGFEIEHQFHGSPGAGGTEYLEPKRMGMSEHHGDVMHHVHEHIKDHGATGVQEELTGGKQEQDGHGAQEAKEHETGCAICDAGGPDKFGERMGEHEVKESDLTNVSHHGYKKRSAADPKTGAGHSKKHPGFAAVQSRIEHKEGVSHKAAGAILAARSRGASRGAHKANPRLNRVRG